MSTTDPNRTGRTSDRPGGGMPRPATPVVAVIIAAVAGLLGLLILKDVKDDSSSGSGGQTAETTTTKAGTPTSAVATTTPVSTIIRTGATVVVANASGKDGAAGTLTDNLKDRGYTTGTATNGTSGKQSTTVIMVKDGDAAAARVGKALLFDMGLTGSTQSLPAEPPIKAGSLGSATVLVLLGSDKAGAALVPLGSSSPATTKPPTTSVATATTGG